jgi:hypothetical protein
MADEETFFVVIGVDELAGDAVGVVAVDLAGVGWKTSATLSLTCHWVVFEWDEIDVGFAEDDEEVGFVGFLEVGGHAGL